MFVPVQILLPLTLFIGLGFETCGITSLLIQCVRPRQIIFKVIDELLAFIVVVDIGSIPFK